MGALGLAPWQGLDLRATGSRVYRDMPQHRFDIAKMLVPLGAN